MRGKATNNRRESGSAILRGVLDPCGCCGPSQSGRAVADNREHRVSAQAGKGGRRAVLALLLLLGLFAALRFLPVLDAMQGFLRWVQGRGAWGPLLLGMAYVAACVFLLPGSLLTLGAGALFGLPVGVLTVVVASNLGAALAFQIGRTVARGWVEAKVAGNSRFQAIDEAVGKQGFKIVLLTRLSPVFPFNLQNYAYGVTKVPPVSYVLASVLGMFPGTLMYVYLGSAARDLSTLGQGPVRGGLAMKIIGLMATVVVTVWVTRIARGALSDAAPGSLPPSSVGAS